MQEMNQREMQRNLGEKARPGSENAAQAMMDQVAKTSAILTLHNEIVRAVGANHRLVINSFQRRW